MFPAGALLGRLGLGRKAGAEGWFAAGLAAFALALASMGLVSVVFLGLFLVPSVLHGLSSRRRVSRALPFLAAADLCIALALTQRHAGRAVWSLPLPGGFRAGAILVGSAAILRLAGAALEPPGGMPMLGWWQGIFLVWWVGSSAAELLTIAGSALVAAGLVTPAKPGRGFAIAGGLAALLGAAGYSDALFVVGLAGCAWALGERAVASFTLVVLPLSAVWLSVPSQLSWGLLPAIAVPALLLLASQGLVSSGAAGWGGRIPAAAAAIATFRVAAEHFSTLVWLLYALGGAWLLISLTTRSYPAVPQGIEARALDQDRPGLTLVTWLLIAGAIAVWLRLLMVGVGTGFL